MLGLVNLILGSFCYLHDLETILVPQLYLVLVEILRTTFLIHSVIIDLVLTICVLFF